MYTGATVGSVESIGVRELRNEVAAALRITPELQSAEEAARLWSALQAKYRPSAAYKVSAVLIGAAEDDVDGHLDAVDGGLPAARRARRKAS